MSVKNLKNSGSAEVGILQKNGCVFLRCHEMAVKTPKELRLTMASCIFYILMKFETILGVLFKTVTNFSFFSCRGTRLDHQNVHTSYVEKQKLMKSIVCLFLFFLRVALCQYGASDLLDTVCVLLNKNYSL